MADATSRRRLPLAIIGMACRLPGADDLQQFWELMAAGRSAIRELPPDRLDQDLYYDPRVGVAGKTSSKLGGVISHRRFDRDCCPLPERLARSADKTHLLMCEVAAAACRHGKLDPFNLPLKNTGVFIGHDQGSTQGGDFALGTCIEQAAQFLREVDEFRQLPDQQQENVIGELVESVRRKLPQRSVESPIPSAGMVAGTISKALGLSGPYLAIDSACASSLQAMLLGARALQLGRVEMAIVGGASDCKPDTLVEFSKAQAISATGSRPFDAQADGVICAEGYVALVMKTLPRAVADGDPIYAVVRGLGVSSDGRGKGLWAPRKEGQIKAIQRAYTPDVKISQLQFIEAHATSTPLGDAVELSTLVEVLKDQLPPGKKIPISSVKANIGHTLESAGIAGVIKTILCMRQGMIPPAINVRALNPKIDWEGAPIYVPTSAVPWPAPENGQPRRAGVNAFGLGGLNMHVVLDEFTASARHLVRTPREVTAAQIKATPPADQDAIAVVGRGCVLPGAANMAEFWDLLVSGRDPKRHVPSDRWRADPAYEPSSSEVYRTSATLGGFVTDFQYDWRRHKIPPKQIEQADPLQFMLLEAVDQAMHEAAYDHKPFDRTRVGVVVGTEFGGDFAFELQMGLRLPEIERTLSKLLGHRAVSADRIQKIRQDFSQALLQHWPALFDETGSFQNSSLASRISRTWDLMGGAAAVDSGTSSAMSALSTCRDMLLASDCDMMICAAGQRRLGLPAYEALAITGVLATAEHSRAPLDARAGGYVPGEGAGALLLKRLADARRDGDEIHTIIRSSEAAHSPHQGEAVKLAMQRSLEYATISPADLAVMEVDSSGKPEIDNQQLCAIASVLGSEQRQQPVMIGTVIGQIGHTQGASGMASLLKAGLEIEHGQMPDTSGLESPAKAIAESPRVLRAAVSLSPIRFTAGDGGRMAGVCSSSGGLAYHVIVEHNIKVSEGDLAP